jgi:CRISPR-associated protein Cas1
MGTLYLDHSDVILERSGEVLTVRGPGAAVQHVPMRLLDRVVVMANIGIPARTLVALATAGIGVTIVGSRQRVAHVLPDGPGDALRIIAQVRCHESKQIKARLAAWMLRRKLLAHRRQIVRWMELRPDVRLPLFRARDRLSARMREVRERTETVALRGLEGAAARDYFEALAAVLPPEMGFQGRNRRPPRDPANAALSLGYTLLHAEATGALAAAGLDPRIGFLHDPSWGRASLAADLAEGYRTEVDDLLRDLCRDGRLRADHFGREGEAVLLGKAGRQIFFPAWEQRMKPVRLRLYRFAARLVGVLQRLAIANGWSP